MAPRRAAAALLAVAVVVAAAAAAATTPAAAWDAGPAACVHSPCTGGALAAEDVEDSSRAWDDSIPAAAAAAAAAGCGPRRELYAGRCYVRCPPGARRTGASTCTHTVRWRGNTHVWVVDGALALLSRSASPVARAAAAAMNGTACRSAWEEGLWGEDAVGRADNPLDGDRRGSHFYNARGVKYDGSVTSTTTYTYFFGGTDNSALVEATAAVGRLGPLRAAPSAATCRSLGAALHYVTDMMPFHTSGFSAFSSPALLHAVAEYYVPSVQGAHPPRGAWSASGPGRGGGVEAAFVSASVRSNGLAPALIGAFADGAGACTMTPDFPVVYRGYCFLGDPAVDREVGRALALGYETTATWLAELWRTRA